MIAQIELSKFRGYSRFHATLTPHAFLVGPNSAGKSTIIEALALAEKCLRLARRRSPSIRVQSGQGSRRAYPIPSPPADELEDPVRYEFGASEASVVVTWTSGASLHMLWPEEDEYGRTEGVFWLESVPGTQAEFKSIADRFTPIFVVPVVTPLDQIEELKSIGYVKDKVGSRLSSKHFRNNLRIMKADGNFDDFKDFIGPWLPEIDLQDIEFVAAANRLALFYTERQSRVPKEIAWAGDGMQIWLQLLWHLHRARGSSTIVLDEPEVYLHPDLQRRLVRLLEDLDSQVIMASHSSEVITEALPESIAWIDRRTTAARRTGAAKMVAAMSDSLGSNYNLSLVRTLRSRTVLAVEGATARTLRAVARTVSARSVATETDISIVPIRSFSSWASAEPLKWIAKDMLTGATKLAVLLNMDLRPESFNRQIIDELRGDGIYVHIWSAREMLNFLLTPQVLARSSGTDEYAMADHLLGAFEQARTEASAWWSRQDRRFGDVRPEVDVIAEFDDRWGQRDGPLNLVSPERVISELNRWLDAEGYRTLSSESIARSAKLDDLPLELVSTLLDVEEL
ncbi:AAA family ATPase [Mycobacterium sp. ITM-2016-00317]|uniref:ATP-dependent nuclease n=1 Tax=Mycobacterium sp. ITM-2016-00317 TaxID=2099694 RepID=UPI00287F90F2|nr:AAA family ATPase [Mycobacterium sp. ITM-2016-00317]WNG88500.1 AAA family ATPase [Mycobacterium sp. ITM-2016-00317]